MSMMASEKEKREAEDCATELYIYLSHISSPVAYSLYEIAVPNHLPSPPTTKSAQLKATKNPNPLPTPNPILQLKRLEYPEDMCCVQLGSKFYFFGGKYAEFDHPFVDQDVYRKYQHVKRFTYPLDLYIFDPTTKKLINGAPMNTGKAYPLAFVIDHKIYVLGSTFAMPDQSSLKFPSKEKTPKPYIKNDIETHVLFEVYDPVVDKWTVLPNQPPIRDSNTEWSWHSPCSNSNTEWSWHSIVGRKVLLVAREVGKYRLYCFDLDTNQWVKYLNRPFFPRLSFLGGTEFVEGTLYGCRHNIVAAIKDPLADLLAEEGTLYYPSKEMGMDAIYHNLPPLVHSSTSSSLLHLGNGIFCFLVSGNPELPSGNFPYMHYDPVADDKKRAISIVIFQALGETYGVKKGCDDEFASGLFTVKLMYSAHCVFNTPFPNQGYIKGFFFIKTAGSKLVGKRERIDHPLGSDVETVGLTKLCDLIEIIKLTQSQLTPLRNTLDAASQALIEERESTERCLEDHQGEHKRPCDVFKIIKLTQTQIASLKNALDVAGQALIVERQSIEHHLQDHQREHKMPCVVFEIIKLIQTQIASLKIAFDLASHALIDERQSIERHLQEHKREHKRPCDVFEITKTSDMPAQEFTALQTEIASLKNALDAAIRLSRDRA